MRNRVNIKHVVGETNSITPGAIIMVKFNSKRYKASIIDLIDWMAPKSTAQRRRSPRTAPRQRLPAASEGKSAVV